MTVDLRHQCARCSSTADYRCETREVTTARVERHAGGTRVIQPYQATFLCAPCTRNAVASDDPPRAVEQLPGRHPHGHKPAPPELDQPRLGDDWGTR